MTTATANPEDMTDAELEALQLKEDGEAPGTDPKVGTDVTTDEATTQATDTATPDTDAAAAPAAGAEVQADTQPAKVEGVASKDGSRILPYAALQAERRAARTANARYESTAKELEAAKQLIADMKAGKTPDAGEVTEADVAQMEQDFPDQGKKMRALFERAQQADSNKPAPKPADVEAEDPVQEAIDQVPLLVEWQHGDAEKFTRAQEIDQALQNSPKWRGKPLADRFAHATAMVAEEFDIALPSSKPSTTPKPTPSPDPKTVIASAPRTNPNTLSDFKGGAIADHGTADFKKMAPTAMLDRFMDMTDAEMDAQLARLG